MPQCLVKNAKVHARRHLCQVVLAAFCMAALAPCSPLNAFDYPSKPVRIIVPYPAGSPSDVRTRRLAEELGRRLGQRVIVENRPGAAGNIGTAMVAHAPADGYTLLYANSGSIAINPHLYANPGFNGLRDFAPIATVTRVPYVLLVRSDSPIRSLNDLIEAARRDPGRLSYASGGAGSPSEIPMEIFKRATGISIIEIPYKGEGPGVIDLLGGHVSMMFPSLPAVSEFMRNGKLRALAITTSSRSKVLPDVATFAELGYPTMNYEVWIGYLAPAGTPRAIIDRLSRELVAVVNTPQVRKWLEDLGNEVATTSPEEFAAMIDLDHERFGKLVRELHLKVE